MIVFGHDGFYKSGNNIANVWKPDFEKNIPALTQGQFGFKHDKHVRDSELFYGNQKELDDVNYHHFFSDRLNSVDCHINDAETNYYYPIYIIDCGFWTKQEARYPQFNEKVATDLIEGRAKILIVYIIEAMHLSRDSLAIFNTWAANNKLPEESIIVLSCSHDYDEYVKRDKVVKHICYNNWEWTMSSFINRNIQKQFIHKIKQKTKRTKKFVCYNRRHKPHRTKIVHGLKLRNMLCDGLISYGPPITKDEEYDILRLTNNDQEFLDMLPLTFDERDLEINFADNFEIHDYLETYFHVVTESFWHDHRNTFYSEKVFKPILGMQPFFLLSTPKSLEQLRENGYKTFSKWFDESYDNVFDLNDRVRMIQDEMRRLCDIPEKELCEMLVDMLPVLEHNYNNFIYRTKNINKWLQQDLEGLWK